MVEYLESTSGGGSWAAGRNEAGQWIQADLEEVKVIVKIATQGRHDHNQYVESFKVMTSYGRDLEFILEFDGSEKVFPANSDVTSVVENCIAFVQANVVRVVVVTWVNHISMRWEIFALENEGKPFNIRHT